jgi:hypothetical protein
MLDQARMPWFAELNRSLTDVLDAGAFIMRIRESTRRLEQLAAEIVVRARVDHPGLDAGTLNVLATPTQSHNRACDAKEAPMLHPATV